MNYPENIEINGKIYKINTSFKVAIECDAISQNEETGEMEKILAIIYLLFGDEALNDIENDFSLVNDFYDMAIKYLLCGEEKKKNNKKPDMDYIEDYSYIKTSFRSDFGINIDEEDLHWWEFYNMINGLSNSEFGNCCILNRVRNIRNMDLKDIKDKKEREKIIEAKKSLELKRNKKERKMTEKQKESVRILNEILKKRKE